MLEWFRRLGSVIDCIFCYYTVNLGRSAAFSFALLALVLLLRKLPLFRGCFQRVVLWSFFLWLPFVGGLKLFYETRFGVRGFLWWAAWNYNHFLISRIYFLTMAVYGGILIYRRKRLLRSVKNLEHFRENIYICDSTVTPFAAGLIFPKIVLPKVMAAACGAEELETIIFHEKTHIRLGHLWCLFVWDVLRVLLWPNIFMTLCMKELKADLEEVCDRVTIQKSGESACDYGFLLLKCIRLLYSGRRERELAGSVAFVGETGGDGYRDMKRRILRIADYRRYGIKNTVFIFAVGLSLLGAGFLGIHRNSYARYTQLEDITVIDDTGCHVILEDSERLRQAVTFDEEKVTVKTEEMNELLRECGAQTDGIYILFGGFMKQPGVGGGGNMVYADNTQFTGQEFEIAYDNRIDVVMWIFMMM